MRWILGLSAFAVVFALAATMTVPAQTITPDQATLKLFPPEATGVASIDIAELRNSQLFKDLAPQGKYPGGAKDFIEATGFQPERDVDQVTVAKIGKKEFVAIVRARYDHFKVEQFVKDRGADIEAYLGRTLYIPRRSESSEMQVAVSFLDDVIVAGNIASVKQVIDRLAAPAASILDNSEVMAGIRGIEYGNQIWAVGKFDLDAIPPEVASIPSPVLEVVKGFKGGSYQMRLDTGVHVKAIGNFTDDQAAKSTADLVRGLLAVARLQVYKQPDLVSLLEGVRIDYAGISMTVRFDGDGELLKKLQSKRTGAVAE
jgi:hypothetical protein